jgi:hypothetical protein
MYTQPMILPLESEGRIYCLQDENGKTIGTGTRETCELLMYIIKRQKSLAQLVVGSRPAVGCQADLRSAVNLYCVSLSATG